MKSMPKWMFLPPALAALLILGSLSMASGAAEKPRTKTPAAGATTGPSATNTGTANPTTNPTANRNQDPNPAGAPETRPALSVPRTPDMWQMMSAFAGVLLLGIGGLLLLRRLQKGPRAPRGANLLSLRQTLRLSARQAIHAIEFDDRIVLVGETDRSLALLDSGKLPDRVADEAEIVRRAASLDANAADDERGDDDGAVPKNLVIPRPASPLPRRLPQRPMLPRPAPAPTPRHSAPAHPQPAAQPSDPMPGLADFRNLLQKAGRA